MTDISVVAQTSIWRIALANFMKSWKPWLRLAVWFFLVDAALSCAGIKSYLDAHVYLNSHPGEWATYWGLETPHMIIDQVCAFVELAALYFFSVLFLKDNPITAPPSPKMKSLLFFWLRYVQVCIIVLLWAALAAGCFLVLAALIAFIVKIIMHGDFARDKENIKTAINYLAAIAGVIFVVVATFWSYQYLFVESLVASEIKRPLQISRQLVRGSFWKVFVSYLPLFIFGFLVLLIDLIGFHISHKVNLITNERIAAEVVFRVFLSALSLFHVGISACYCCTMARIYCNERVQSNSTFSLT